VAAPLKVASVNNKSYVRYDTTFDSISPLFLWTCDGSSRSNELQPPRLFQVSGFGGQRRITPNARLGHQNLSQDERPRISGEAMICSHCQAANSEQSSFCMHCGAALTPFSVGDHQGGARPRRDHGVELAVSLRRRPWTLTSTCTASSITGRPARGRKAHREPRGAARAAHRRDRRTAAGRRSA